MQATRFSRHALLAIAIAVLSGCATEATREAMTASVPSALVGAIPQELRGQLAVREVSGGRETNPLLKSNVSSSGFEGALDASLRNAGLAAPSKTGARYGLNAIIQNVGQPFMGFDMTVTMTVEYQLVEQATNTIVWKTMVTRPYTAKMSDAFVGTERLRLANEGAARVNIEGFVDELAKSGPRK